MRPYFSVVGMRCGDAFWTANWLRQHFTTVDLRVGQYAHDVWETVNELTDLEINIVEVVPDRPANDIADVLRLNEGDPSTKALVGAWSPKSSKFVPCFPGHIRYDLLTPFEDLPESYVCVHTESISRWKNHPEILKVNFPLPVVCVGQRSAAMRPEWIDRRGLSWRDTLRVVWNASVVVVIASSVLSACMFLMKRPVVVCSFRSDQPHVGPLYLGVDLVRPSPRLIIRSVNFCLRWRRWDNVLFATR